MPRPYDVMAAGHVCIDVIPRFAHGTAKAIGEILRPGKLVEMGPATMSTGGPVSNTGIAMKRLGNRVCFCARIGDDEFGRLTLDILRQSGNADGIHVVPGCVISYTIVLAPAGIDRIFLHNPGANKCRHFHFGYPPLMKRMFEDEGNELQHIFQIAKEAGATTSCDMTLPDPDSPSGKAPWKKILAKILPYVDIYVPSVEETFYMLDPDGFLKMKARHNHAELIDYFTPEEYSRLADQVLALGTKMVTLKSGPRGFYIKTASRDTFAGMGAAQPGDPANWSRRELWAPAFVVDHFGSATGSGDSAIAGLLSGFLRGLTIEESLKYATGCGLQNVRVLDAVSGIKTWDETTAMIRQNLPMIDIHNSSPNWSWHQPSQLWAGPSDPLRHSR